jgi:protein-tyrosine phosphatase
VEFIDRALSFSYGLVFVNCLLGYSRSTAIVAAYLMKKKNMSASEALLYLRKTREVKPNVGFLQQLGKLDDELRAQRYRRL